MVLCTPLPLTTLVNRRMVTVPLFNDDPVLNPASVYSCREQAATQHLLSTSDTLRASTCCDLRCNFRIEHDVKRCELLPGTAMHRLAQCNATNRCEVSPSTAKAQHMLSNAANSKCRQLPGTDYNPRCQALQSYHAALQYDNI